MKFKQLFLSVAVISLLSFTVGCGSGGGGGESSDGSGTGSGGGSGSGTLSLLLQDAFSESYKAVYVTITEVQVCKGSNQNKDCDWRVVPSPGKTYNLLELVNGVREQLGVVDLEAGSYTQMRLIIGRDHDGGLNVLGLPHKYPNYVIIDNADNEIHELKIPSGFQTGIKIVHGFVIEENKNTELILDFDASKSVVRAGASGKWLLKPTIKVLETEEYSIISGNAGAAGVLVSAQTYNLSAVPEKKVQIEAATGSDVNGDYKLFLKPGLYTLVGYQDGFSTFYKNTKVQTLAGNTYTEDFSLSSSATGTFSTGEITISGADPDQYATISIRQDATVNGNPEQIEVKSLNVANGGFITGAVLPVLPVGNYTAVISSYGKTTKEQSFPISANTDTNIGDINL